MKNLKALYEEVYRNGELRKTRTGNVISIWDARLQFNLQDGFPAVTSKKLAWQTCVGELLWFLSGSQWVEDLKHYTFADRHTDKWTIWTDDAKRWNESIGEECDQGYVGALYPVQWRDYNYAGVDQIGNLIYNLIHHPNSRDHIVMAWNPEAIAENQMALKPCHLGFQCYVDELGFLHMKWWQRSVDCFLGLPINIASYALLLSLLAKWTGLEPGTLTADLGDVHIYENHKDQVYQYLCNEEHTLPDLVLPDGTETLDQTLKLTAKDFKNSLTGYVHEGMIKAPLSVGN